MDAYNGAQCSNIADFIFHTINNFGGEIAQVDLKTKTKITFKEIINRSKYFAHYLVKNGVKHGDVICLCSKNTTSYCWILLGSLYAGATCALISSTYKPRELEHAIKICKPKWIVHTEFSQEQLSVIKDFQDIKSIEISDSLIIKFSKDETTHSDYFNWNGLCSSDIHDTAFILISSGTTGLPKGVMITHNNVIWALLNSKSWFRSGAKALGLMPFYHAYGLILMLMSLCECAKLVVMANFKMADFVSSISKYQITHLHLVPSLLATITKIEFLPKDAFKTVKYIWTGAGQINAKHQEMVLSKLGDSIELYHTYGMTETTFVTFMGKFRKDKPGSCGKAIPSMKNKVICTTNGDALKAGELGEICFQGPMVMKGYIGNAEATAKTIDENGWLHSGDIGYFDEDGYYFIVERIKEIIKYQGFQVSPSEIESVLLLHDGVADVAVIGQPHSVYGEIPQAYVVKNQESVTEETLIAFVQNELSSYKQLRGGVRFVDFIPKTASGKILRNEIKKLFLQ